MFPSGLSGLALLLFRASWPIVAFFAHFIVPLAIAAQMAGVAVGDRALESTASAIH
jgi:hypothetical protein